MFGDEETAGTAAESKTEAATENKAPETKGKNGNGNGKKANGNGKEKTAAKKSAKKADAKKAKDTKKTNGKAKEKAAKPAKAKAEKPAKKQVERDQFGFRKGSKKSEAAKLYASKKGATLAEVKEKTGSSQLNLLKELEDAKFKIEKTKVAGAGKKQVTRYKIVVPEKSASK